MVMLRMRLLRSATSFLFQSSIVSMPGTCCCIKTAGVWRSERLLSRHLRLLSSSQFIDCHSCILLTDGSRREHTTTQKPVAFKVFKDTLRHLPDGEKLKAGDMIEFRKESDLLLGVVEGQRENKWIVHDQNGTETSVRPQDIAFHVPGADYTRSDIGFFFENANGVDDRCIEVAWQTMKETREPLTLTYMAQLLLNDDSPTSMYTAYTLLKNDRKYFKQVGRDPPLYFRMLPEDVQLLQQNEAKLSLVRQEQQQFKNDVTAVLTQSYEDRPSADHWTGGDHKDRIVALKEFAMSDGPSPTSRNLAMESLRICGLSLTPNGAVRLLESIRVFGKHEPIALLRAGIKAEFPSEVLKEVEIAGRGPDQDAAIRRDLRHLTVFCIDDSGTREIDDAISIERMANGRNKVWIHVSDPSRWVALDSELDLEARKRVISLYVPTGAIPVYPWKLAEGKFSLRKNIKCCALSFGALLNDEGELESYEVTPSLVMPQISLNYSEAESAIEKGTHSDLNALVEISNLRAAWRKSKGAVDIAMPECDVKVIMADSSKDEDPEVKVSKSVMDAVSRKMVSEFMILAGEIAGKIGVQHSLVLPYRSQVSAVLPKASELNKLPEGPCRAAALRKRMTRGITSSNSPTPHSSLGIDAYVQITSPIRRYSDFLAHVQLKAHLRNEAPPLSVSDLESLLVMTSRAARNRSKTVDETVNYWVAEYFKQHQQDSTWTATMLFWVKQSQGLSSILLDDLGLEHQMRIDRSINPGDKLKVAVAGVDVKSGMVRFEEVMSKSGKLHQDI